MQLKYNYNDKCTVIAHKQIDAGTKGITCAKLGEAKGD